MRKSILAITGLFLCMMMYAQTPQGITHQAVVRDTQGNLIINTSIGVQVSILQAEIDGTSVYVETHSPESNANGLVTYVIGQGTVVHGVFADIDWSDGPYFLKTEVDPTGGTSYSIEGTTQFHWVPYAFYSEVAGELSGGIVETDPIFSASTAAGITLTNTMDWDDAQSWGDHTEVGYLTEEVQTLADVLNKGNDGNAQQIKNLASPTDPQDATTKAYVDELEEKLKALENSLIDAGMHPSKFKDTRDGNIYKYIKIGNQVWMAENLRYLPEVVGPATGSKTTPHYYVYDYNGTDVNAAKATDNYQNYGVLYNWSAAMAGSASSSTNPSGVQGVCPAGWHIPSDAEWTDLVNYVVSQGYPDSDVPDGAGNALKSCRQVGSPLGGACNTSDHPRWDSHHTNYGTDVFGFSSLPGGCRGTAGSYGSFGGFGYWWSAVENTSLDAWHRGMSTNDGNLYSLPVDKVYGFSLRCVRD